MIMNQEKIIKKRKPRLDMIGKPPWWVRKGVENPSKSLKFRETASKRMKENPPKHKDSCKCFRCSGKTWNKGKGEYLSSETRKRIIKIRLEKVGSPFKGKTHTEKANEKNRQMHLGKKMSEKTKKRMRDVWKDPAYRKKREKIFYKWMSKMRHFPNKKEKELNDILQLHFPNEWKYVGNGYTWINGKNPDFLNINGKKMLIELFGDYWHRGDDGKERVNHFAKHGFKTLIIREYELKDKDIIINNINEFIKNDSGVCNE